MKFFLKKWIIVYYNYGRLGNRLHTHANVLGWCLANKYNLLNLSFIEYSDLFKRGKNNQVYIHIYSRDLLSFIFKIHLVHIFLNKILLSEKWLNRLSIFVKTICRNENETINQKEIDQEVINSNKIVIIKAWDLNFKNALISCSEQVKEILTPKDIFANEAKNQILKLRLKYDFLVGVHARRSDYREYLHGIHYHSWKSYLNWIKQISQIIEESYNLNAGFLLCSDEQPDAKIFNQLPIHFFCGDQLMTDLHMLSSCDFIVGPPSSFGTWASWYGRVPRLCVQKDSFIQSLDQFTISSTC